MFTQLLVGRVIRSVIEQDRFRSREIGPGEVNIPSAAESRHLLLSGG